MELSAENFTRFRNEGRIVIINFHADWCEPCQTYIPEFKEFGLESWEDRVVIAKMNIDYCPTLTAELGIKVIPTTIMYKGNEEVWRVSGAQSKDYLKSVLEDNR